MAQKKSPPPREPLFINEEVWELHPLWAGFFEQFLTKAATQSDESADPVPKADFDALIDKLQAAGIME